jgi:hypothetical protein
LAAIALGGFPPKPQGVTTVNSKRTPGVSITYKEVCSSSARPRFLCDLFLSNFQLGRYWLELCPDEPPMLA